MIIAVVTILLLLATLAICYPDWQHLYALLQLPTYVRWKTIISNTYKTCWSWAEPSSAKFEILDITVVRAQFDKCFFWNIICWLDNWLLGYSITFNIMVEAHLPNSWIEKRIEYYCPLGMHLKPEIQPESGNWLDRKFFPMTRGKKQLFFFWFSVECSTRCRLAF